MPSNRFLPLTEDGYRPCVDSDVVEIDLGHRYSAFFSYTITGTGSTCIIALTTNSAKICHAWVSVESDKSGMYEMYEGAVISGGSAITSFNNNRNSGNISDAVAFGNPTVATVGTFIGSHVIGSTTGGASKSGGSAQVNRYQLKLNTTYIWRFVADADNTRVTHGLYWRECDA